MFRMNFICVVLSVVLLASFAFGQTRPGDEPTDKKNNPALPTLWIIGDSTVRNGTKGQMGWGDPIQKMFDTSRINVINRAIGGRSSRTFRTDGRWEKILAEAKPGDFVLMQFGHNDSSKLAGDNRERGTIRGMSDETQEVTLTLPPKTGQKEVVHSFGWYMKTYCAEAKAKGMTPIVCSYIPRCPQVAGQTPTTQFANVGAAPTTRGTMSSYQLWAKEAAEAESVQFIDLNSIISGKYTQMEPKDIKEKYFTTADNVHTNPVGAEFNARCVVEGLKASDSALKQFIKAE